MAGAEDGSVDGAFDLPENTWTVARVNEAIEATLEEAANRFPTYVVGEVSDVDHYDFGTFFELRDIEDDAVISCLAWSYAVDDFEHDLEEGAAGIVQASVDFYPERGDTQLVVSDYWPVGESERAAELEALRAELEAEGLLDPTRKRALPSHPQCIGVVTSPSGSAREDFTAAVRDRAPSVTIKLCGATVQGENAVPSIVGAVQRLERDAEVDVVVVTRGGGADSDLWCFNEEPVVRSIADCTTPVVVAVGHEDDETLSEAVADERAMTPTDAGSAAVHDASAVRDTLGQLETRVDTAYRNVVADEIEAYERRVESAYTSLQQAVASRRAARQRAADLEQRVSVAYRRLVAAELRELEQRLETAVRDVERAAATEAVTAQAASGRVGDLEARIDQAYRARVDRKLTALETRIDAAHRELEADARIEAGAAEARRLRVLVVVLVAVLVLGAAAVGLLLL